TPVQGTPPFAPPECVGCFGAPDTGDVGRAAVTARRRGIAVSGVSQMNRNLPGARIQSLTTGLRQSSAQAAPADGCHNVAPNGANRAPRVLRSVRRHELRGSRV